MQKCVNINFKEVGMINPCLVKELDKEDKTKFCYFHKSHGHNIDEFVYLNDLIDELIKK